MAKDKSMELKSMNYFTLTEQIYRFANRNAEDEAFLDSIPYFIANAQQRIWLEAKDMGFETLMEIGKFKENSPIVAKPINWNKTVSFSLLTLLPATAPLLEMRTYEYCLSIWPTPTIAQANNPPLYYCDREFAMAGSADTNYAEQDSLVNTPYSAWYVAPTPVADMQYQITYLANVQSINRINTTNILTIKFPNLLFYACMCEAFSWTNEPERLQVFEAMYGKALQSVNKETDERHTDRTSKVGMD